MDTDSRHHDGGMPLPMIAIKQAMSKLICSEDILKQEEIGVGYYATVYKVTYKPTCQLMALKVPNRNDTLQRFTKELQLMKDLNHENILRYYGSCIEGGRLASLTEYMEGGSLAQLLANDWIESDWRLRVKLARDVAEGVNYLHNHSIIHRDLSAPNILIRGKFDVNSRDFSSRNLTAVVADLGLCLNLKQERVDRTSCVGNPYYIAPECLNRIAPYSTASDVFAYGLILCEIITRKCNDGVLIPRTSNFGLDYCKLPVNPDCPRWFLELSCECCCVHYAMRPIMAAVIKTIEANFAFVYKMGTSNSTKDYESNSSNIFNRFIKLDKTSKVNEAGESDSMDTDDQVDYPSTISGPSCCYPFTRSSNSVSEKVPHNENCSTSKQENAVSESYLNVTVTEPSSKQSKSAEPTFTMKAGFFDSSSSLTAPNNIDSESLAARSRFRYSTGVPDSDSPKTTVNNDVDSSLSLEMKSLCLQTSQKPDLVFSLSGQVPKDTFRFAHSFTTGPQKKKHLNLQTMKTAPHSIIRSHRDSHKYRRRYSTESLVTLNSAVCRIAARDPCYSRVPLSHQRRFVSRLKHFTGTTVCVAEPRHRDHFICYKCKDGKADDALSRYLTLSAKNDFKEAFKSWRHHRSMAHGLRSNARRTRSCSPSSMRKDSNSEKLTVPREPDSYEV